MKEWKGGLIAEGLSDPTIISRFTVYEATISRDNMPVDYEGHVGRWHGYGVRCSREEISALQPYVLQGWYAHFWHEDTIIVVYHDKVFELAKDDRSTWREAVEHGKAQGIPEEELDFPTD
ncbi:MAG: hypothetical protein JXA09_08445 [Anaerolineae bacterium]|nr:hypothetical protein [Anaerolineae bacterium]